MQLPLSRRSDGKSWHQSARCRSWDRRGSHTGDRGAVWALLWDGIHIPAVQDLCGEWQRCPSWAVWALAVYSMPHSLAGGGLFDHLIPLSLLLFSQPVCPYFPWVIVGLKSFTRKHWKQCRLRSVPKIFNKVCWTSATRSVLVLMQICYRKSRQPDAFLVHMYYMHSGYRTSIFGKKSFVLYSNF